MNMCHVIYKNYIILLILFSIVSCISVARANDLQTLENLRANGTQVIDTAVSPEFKILLDKKGPVVAVLADQLFSASDNKLADRFTTALMQGGWRVIERSRIEHVLSEQKFSMSGLLEPRARLAIGRILGINFIVVCNEALSINGSWINDRYFAYMEGGIKIIDIESGAIMASSSFKWLQYQDQVGPQWVLFDLHNKIQSSAYQR